VGSLIVTASFVGTKALANELADTGRGVGITQVVPFPRNIGTPVVKEYQKLLGADPGQDNFSFTSLEGFIAIKLLVEGLKRVGKEPMREKLITALDTMRDFDLGDFYVTYSPLTMRGNLTKKKPRMLPCGARLYHLGGG
jgi:branched-chain amino acid transport system substrate-binding protein